MNANGNASWWRSYLLLARELAREGLVANDEAKLRSSVSRAYYAAFIAAHRFLRDRDNDLTLRTRRDSLHDYVRNQFALGPDDREQIADYLGRLHKARIQADYFDTFRQSPEEIEFLLDNADEIFLLLGSLQPLTGE